MPGPHPQYLKDNRKDSSLRHIYLKIQEPYADQRTLAEDNSSTSSPSPGPDTSDDSSEVVSFLREVKAEREARAVKAE